MKKGDIYIYYGKVQLTNGKLGQGFINKDDPEDSFCSIKKRKDNRYYDIGLLFEITKYWEKDETFIIDNVKDETEGMGCKYIDNKKKIDRWKLDENIAILKHQEIQKMKATKAKMAKDSKIENLTLKEIKAKYGGRIFMNRAIVDYLERYLRS